MRKITKDIADAFNNRKSLTRSGNGATSTDGEAIYLHGNKIVERRDGGIWVSTAGWDTTTTKERLKPFVSTHTEKGQLHITIAGETKPWDGDWIRIGPA
jgi:hypothetical protein